jgi:hypothetical protein
MIARASRSAGRCRPIARAVDAAVEWLRRTKLSGVRVERALFEREAAGSGCHAGLQQAREGVRFGDGGAAECEREER